MDFVFVCMVLVLILIGYFLLKWRPKKGIWYRNSNRSFNMGHLNYTRNCFIIVKGKKIRGSFKVLNDKVLYSLNWKYHRKAIKSISMSKCSFMRTKEHIPLDGNGTSEDYITNYIMKIKG